MFFIFLDINSRKFSINYARHGVNLIRDKFMVNYMAIDFSPYGCTAIKFFHPCRSDTA